MIANESIYNELRFVLKFGINFSSILKMIFIHVTNKRQYKTKMETKEDVFFKTFRNLP